MSEQGEFDLGAGRAARDEGMARVLANGNADWVRRARTHIGYLAWKGVQFTADDVIAVVGMPPTGSRNIVGALFAAASAQGVIVRVGEGRALRKARHAGRVSVWKGAKGDVA